MTKLIYLSQPDFTKDYQFDSGVKRRITRKLRSTDYKIIVHDALNGASGPSIDQTLLKSFVNADLILFTPDWETSDRCKLEHQICETYNLTYIDL